jgi:hypothetical protein
MLLITHAIKGCGGGSIDIGKRRGIVQLWQRIGINGLPLTGSQAGAFLNNERQVGIHNDILAIG